MDYNVSKCELTNPRLYEGCKEAISNQRVNTVFCGNPVGHAPSSTVCASLKSASCLHIISIELFVGNLWVIRLPFQNWNVVSNYKLLESVLQYVLNWHVLPSLVPILALYWILYVDSTYRRFQSPHDHPGLLLLLWIIQFIVYLNFMNNDIFCIFNLRLISHFNS